MNNIYKIFPNRDFRDNWGYFNSIFKSEIKCYYRMPIEKIMANDNINSDEKIIQVKNVISKFSEKEIEINKWRDEILEKFIHSKE